MPTAWPRMIPCLAPSPLLRQHQRHDVGPVDQDGDAGRHHRRRRKRLEARLASRCRREGRSPPPSPNDRREAPTHAGAGPAPSARIPRLGTFYRGAAFLNCSAMRATSRSATSSFVISGQSSTPSFVNKVHAIMRPAHDAALRGNVVGDDPVAALPLQFRLGVGDEVLRLRREADEEPRPLGVPREPGEDVGILRRASAPAPLPSFLIFSLPGSTRQSATAAAITAMSAGSAASTASCISRAVVTETVRTPGGGANLDRPADERHVCTGARQALRRWRVPAAPTSGWRDSAPGRSARASARR